MAQITLDYYHGAYGPTIHVEVPTRAQLADLRHMMTALKDGTRQVCSIRSLPEVTCRGFADLVFLHTASWECTGLRSAYQGEARVFTLLRTPDGWDRLEGLLDGLLQSTDPGHQYLAEGEDGLVIEVYYSPTPQDRQEM